MVSHIQGVPVFAQRADQIPAPLYNLWRRARMRAQLPLRMTLPGMKGMALILEPAAWVVVDGGRSDVPVLAWVEFAPPPERGIHEPVPCKLNYYHYLASGLRARVLEHLEQHLEARLKSRR